MSKDAPAEALGADRLWELMQAGRGLVAELDLDRVINRLLEVARRVTGAHYAALGVLNESRSELERFVTLGVDPEVRRQIGDLPRGRGILGLLIEEPQPLRLKDLGDHPRSYGFPPGHPPMRGFLGVPILIRGEAWGNLYLTEKTGGDFDEDDEGAVVVLADSPIADALAQRHAQRIADPEDRIGVRLATLGVPDAEAALIVPLVYRGTALGVLIAFDRLTGDVRFSRDDEQLLEAFAASAATAVATAKTVEADRLRKSIEAAEAERRRWARELHDETLQGLAGLKVLLSAAARSDDSEAVRAAITGAVEQ